MFIYYFDFMSVGIDVGSKVSWAVITKPDHSPIGKPIKIDHSSIESLKLFIAQVKKEEERNGLKARIFLESTGIYHIPLYRCLKESGFTVLILNPLITDSNKNQGIRKVKSDKTDALRIARTAYTHNLKTSLIPSDTVLNIRELIRDYHKYTDLKTIHVNKLTKSLAIVFPEFTTVFSNTTGKTAMAVLERYRTPQTLLEASKDEVVTFISQVSRRGSDAAYKVYEKLIGAAELAMTFSHQLEAVYSSIEMELQMIRIYDQKKEEILGRIETYRRQNSSDLFVQQIELLQTIPGVGFISAVSIIAEIGNFSAFEKPKQLVAYFGLDPTVKESGKFKATQTRLSKRGSRIARRALFRVVLACIRKNRNGEANNPVLRAFYEAKITQKSKKVAIGALMRKMTNIIFAVLRNNESFKLITPEEHRKRHTENLTLAA